MSGGRFSEEEDEKIIDLVSKHPLLWDMNDREWRNQFKKDLIWNDVGIQLGRPKAECKVRWKSIRDHYKKQKRHEKGMPAGSISTKKRAAYWSQLRFLESLDGGQHVASTSVTQDDVIVEEDDHVQSDHESYSTALPSSYLLEVSDDTPAPTKKPSTYQENNGSKELLTESKEYREDVLNTFIDKMITKQDEDENDLFFRTMAKTVKKFGPPLKTETKKKIFAIVMEMEEANQDTKSE